MKLAKRHVRNAVEMLALMAILVYVITRTTLFLFSEYSPVEKLFSLLLLFGEFFILLHAIGYVIDTIRSFMGRTPPVADTRGYERSGGPHVAVLVAARHEPREVLDQTFIALKNLNYRNKYIYFLDDSSDEKYRREAEELCRQHDLILFRRETRHGAKAGIVNDCLKTLNQAYVAVFDADQCPLPDFLKSVVPLLEADAKLAFVQTPQYYSNIEESRIARGAGFQQAVFYEYICEGKNSDGAMFCCGTNVVFRREALLDVGGFDERSVTEDFATSLALHTKGWRSLYYNHVCAFGMGPEDLGGYFKQQFRWATGTIGVFKRVLWQLIRHPRSLSPLQWWEYVLSGSYYLVGISFAILMICPVTYLLFKIPSFFARPEIYFLAFLPYFMLTMSVFYGVLGTRNYRMKDLFLGQLLNFITFPVYLKGAVSALIGVRTTFGVTTKTRGAAVPYTQLWPQMAILYLNFVAVVWGVNRFVYERDVAIAVNGFWALYHCCLMSSIFYFNRGDDTKETWQTLAEGVEFKFRNIGTAAPGQLTLEDGLVVYIPELLPSGALVMCKVSVPGAQPVIFDGKVESVQKRLGRAEYRTAIGYVTITPDGMRTLKGLLTR